MNRLLTLSLLLVVALVPACNERPACSPPELARIEAAFIQEAVSACEGHTIDECPAYPAIKAKYKTQRDAWVNCR